jgi:hypothetical protein
MRQQEKLIIHGTIWVGIMVDMDLEENRLTHQEQCGGKKKNQSLLPQYCYEDQRISAFKLLSINDLKQRNLWQ